MISRSNPSTHQPEPNGSDWSAPRRRPRRCPRRSPLTPRRSPPRRSGSRYTARRWSPGCPPAAQQVSVADAVPRRVERHRRLRRAVPGQRHHDLRRHRRRRVRRQQGVYDRPTSTVSVRAMTTRGVGTHCQGTKSPFLPRLLGGQASACHRNGVFGACVKGRDRASSPGKERRRRQGRRRDRSRRPPAVQHRRTDAARPDGDLLPGRRKRVAFHWRGRGNGGGTRGSPLPRVLPGGSATFSVKWQTPSRVGKAGFLCVWKGQRRGSAS